MTYKDTSKPVAERVEDLITQMTPVEKVAQLGAVMSIGLMGAQGPDPEKMQTVLAQGIGQVSRVGGILNIEPQQTAGIVNAVQQFLVEHTRLGIPAIIHEECLCGYEAKRATVFPQMIGAAATWEPALVEQMTDIIREQMTVVGARQGLSPVLDIARDARWGRMEETFGEDPYLSSEMAIAYVKGLQGDGLKDGVIATAKHFLGYGLSEGGMNWAPAHIDKRELYEVFARPFEAAIQQANLASVMNAYNELDGVPCGVSEDVLTTLLRDQLGFEGFVVADYFTIATAHNYHHVATDIGGAAVQALKAGLDVELPNTNGYGEPLLKAIEAGEVSMDLIDRAVRRVMEAKFRLGLFENPYADTDSITEVYSKGDGAALAQKIAAKSMTLLKNEGDLLPISKTAGKIAVIGPNANSPRNLFGDYTFPGQLEGTIGIIQSGAMSDSTEMDEETQQAVFAMFADILTAETEDTFTQKNYDVTTIYEAIKAQAEGEVTYARGCDIRSDDTGGFDEAVALAQDADVAVLVLGEKSGLDDKATSGESRDRADLNFPGVQQQLLEAVAATGTPAVLVLVNGRPLSITWAAENIPAILEAYVPGQEGGHAVARTLFGEVNPGGKLPVSVPRSVGQVPVYHYHKPSGGRSHWTGSYVDIPTTPLYPFGHGLSYTTFEYNDLKIDAAQVASSGSVNISVDVTNTGDHAGDEIVQLYLHDREADVTRPVRELAGFKRISLQPGETATVTFTVQMSQLGFYNRAMQYVIEPGNVDVMVGSSALDIRLSGEFEITGGTINLKKRRTFSSEVTFKMRMTT